ncbi:MULTISPECIES: hypothetical protein [unclassified Polaromonas]|jgi:uncharacterized membrane protein YagU involved in acid resistance|uniref:hypothetical protein n=1 Tax=unclassified Polaromonas TaxID=2638319 RepID=UPI000BCDEE88|nr:MULTISPECIES: hypothetical protein [unclassified Polaromonas]OYY34825.1 MAG: hypothetical protein B7Y60_15440 [Polaromonas sp. 35-63-35]OYZ19290.1 MAG: hypothetical protein B7Y28_12155 [Polaromonas sp. 16-63-31]OYZ75359.1 MAG: hypothetical protein B7Y09_24485 [Polaromonas sp. 24-63-21]OZA45375.1 MAG: hypothetical protein B7X88_24685 [Polaromonas sp. 17-63-33]OZA87179.1 MAG: hypothetical protein B7X65_13390 [Polaromonas sp. 39-63-25]
MAMQGMTDRPDRKSLLQGLVKESIRSGTIASIAMIPFGFVFQLLGLRVGHYGKKLLEVFFTNYSEMTFRLLMFIEHFVIGWLSAVPLLVLLVLLKNRFAAWAVGAIYGLGYYVILNSLALPLIFGDQTPWTLGFSVMYPSLVIHIVFGVSIALTSRHFVFCLPRVKTMT